MEPRITLFDILSNLPHKCYSSNVRKTRICLGYKQIPFKVTWLEMPDIEPTFKKLGASPTTKKPDGSDRYTCPVIYDSHTNLYISDSIKIAEYLDEQFPETPKLFPDNSKAATYLFDDFFLNTTKEDLVPIVVPAVPKYLNEISRASFVKRRTAQFNCALEDWLPVGPKRDAQWGKVKEGLVKLANIYAVNGPGKDEFFFGETFSYADVIVVSILLWAKILVPEEFKPAEEWDEGRWGKLISKIGKWNDNIL